MKKILLIIAILSSYSIAVLGQSDIRIKNHNLIFNSEISAGNVYSFAVSSAVTGLINYYLLNDAFFENSFSYAIYKSNVDDLKTRTLNPMGITASELFNNIQAGLKLGYQTYNPNFFNAGIYASAYYKLDQFDVGYEDELLRHKAQRVLLGATALFSFGSMKQSSRVIVEAGCKYSLGLSYDTPTLSDKELLNDGFISHFAIKLASRGLMQNIGVFADINHFNLWKNWDGAPELNNYTIGFTWTITPQQADERRGY